MASTALEKKVYISDCKKIDYITVYSFSTIFSCGSRKKRHLVTRYGFFRGEECFGQKCIDRLEL